MKGKTQYGEVVVTTLHMVAVIVTAYPEVLAAILFMVAVEPIILWEVMEMI